MNLKVKLTGQANDGGTKYVEVMVLLKYLSNFLRTFEMPLINCEINLDLDCQKTCVIVVKNANQDTTFSITDTTLYVSVVTLSTQDNPNLFEQSKSAFKIITNRNKISIKIIKRKTKSIFRLLSWSKSSWSKHTFLCYHLKMKLNKQFRSDIIFQL